MAKTILTSSGDQRVSNKPLILIFALAVLVTIFSILKKFNLFSTFLGEIIMFGSVVILIFIWIKFFGRNSKSRKSKSIP